MHAKRIRKRRRGFTLMEVLLVLAILGALAVMVVPRLLGTFQEAQRDTARSSIKGIEDSVKYYAVDHDGNYPEGGQDVLIQLSQPEELEDGRVREPRLDRIQDPWGQNFFYEYPNTKVANATKPAIWSAGPNKQNEDGGGDDVRNWDELP